MITPVAGSLGTNRNEFTQLQSLHRTDSAFYASTHPRDNLRPGNLRWKGRLWRLCVLVRGFLEDCLRTEGRACEGVVPVDTHRVTDTTSSTSHPSTSLSFPPVSTRPPSRAWNAFTQLNPIRTYLSKSSKESHGEVDRLTAASPEPNLGGWDTRFNATKLRSSGLLFPFIVIPRCFNPFLVLPAPTSRFHALVLGK